MGYLVISATVVADFYLSGLKAGAKSSPAWRRLLARCGFAILFPFVPAVLLGHSAYLAIKMISKRAELKQAMKTSDPAAAFDDISGLYKEYRQHQHHLECRPLRRTYSHFRVVQATLGNFYLVCAVGLTMAFGSDKFK